MEEQPLYKFVEINGKKYCDHKVFGLQDAEWFRDHKVNPEDEAIPVFQRDNKVMIHPFFMDAENREKYKNYYERQKELKND